MHPYPKHWILYVHTLIPPPMIFGLGYLDRLGLRLLVGLGPGTRYIGTLPLR